MSLFVLQYLIWILIFSRTKMIVHLFRLFKTKQNCYILAFIFSVNGIPINGSSIFPCFSPFASLMMYTCTHLYCQNGALIICNNISANQITIAQGQIRAAYLCTRRKRGQLLTNWYDVKEGHSFSCSRKTLTVRLAITPPPYLQLQLPLTPNCVLNLHSNGPKYATFPSAPLCIWLSISL